MLSKKTKNKKLIPEFLFPLTLGFITLAVTGFLILSNWRINQKRADLNNKIEVLKAEVKDLEEKNAQLKTNIGQNQSQDYLEQVARNDLGLKKSGEDVVVVKPPATTTEVKIDSGKSFWQKIWEKIKF